MENTEADSIFEKHLVWMQLKTVFWTFSVNKS